ncbi:hypothetical protein [Kibdelosporangium philippinense]|uniref:hypothetical protein n=1 Tax=Kibdelosporangium philippinense TaxID=211113 RepID=UPI00360B5C35
MADAEEAWTLRRPKGANGAWPPRPARQNCGASYPSGPSRKAPVAATSGRLWRLNPSARKPAQIAAALEVVQAETIFEFPVVVFDVPADLGLSAYPVMCPGEYELMCPGVKRRWRCP